LTASLFHNQNCHYESLKIWTKNWVILFQVLMCKTGSWLKSTKSWLKIISAHFCPVPSVGKSFKLVRKSNQTDIYWILATYLTFTIRVQILFEIIPSRWKMKLILLLNSLCKVFQITLTAEPWKGRSINSIRKSP
jgi:hypothetical protein